MHEYRLVRTQRRTIALQITREGELVVRAPRFAAQAEIDRFVAQHADWIQKHLADVRRRAAEYPELTPEETAECYARAKRELPALTARWSEIMGLTPTAVRITGARTRFGSCSGKNSICYSWRLMRYPPEAIEYVVVHELAHIQEKNHGPRFWELVERFLPDWRARRALLRS